MDVASFVQKLMLNGVRMFLENGKIKVDGQISVLTDDKIAFLRDNKDAISNYLQNPYPVNFPLSLRQRDIWTLYQIAPNNPAYNIMSAVRLTATIDVLILQDAINFLVQRHPMLRVTFNQVNNVPVQTIHEKLHLKLSIKTMQNCSKESLSKWMGDFADQPFNLMTGPLIRSCLIQNKCDGLEENILLLTIHHIVADFWSLDILIKELVQVYEALMNHQVPQLQQLTTSYIDYQEWEQSKIPDEDNNVHWMFWKNHLAGELPLLNIPFDKQIPAVQRLLGDSYQFTIDAKLTAALKKFANENNMTLFIVFMFIYYHVLSEYSRESDIIIGVPTLGRKDSRWQQIVGDFINPIPIRINLLKNISVSLALQQIKSQIMACLEHSDYPFSLLVSKLNQLRDKSRSPIFQAYFVWHKLNQSKQNLKSEETNNIIVGLHEESRVRGAASDIGLIVMDETETIQCRVTYNSDAFTVQTIANFVLSFNCLLRSLVSNKKSSRYQLDMLSKDKYQEVINSWNATDKKLPRQIVTINDLFEKQANNNPQRLALIYEDQQLTYSELNAKANQLAHWLCSKGIGNDDVVAVCMKRCLELPIILLGILKAGACYLPIDYEIPKKRLSFILHSAHMKLLIVGNDFSLDELSFPIINLAEIYKSISEQPTFNMNARLHKFNAAYLIYTSGSTGEPKGALNSHVGLLNRLLWMQEYFNIGVKDRVLQKTPYTFDVSVWEFFWPLIVGSTLVIAPPDLHREPLLLADAISKYEISVLHFVPSMLTIFLDLVTAKNLSSVQHVVCSGEALSPDTVKAFYKKLPHARLTNLYGPTEAAIDVSFWHCDPSHMERVPIGHPITNTQLYVLNEYLQPVPVGAIGELYITGMGLARGYINRADLTATCFWPNPFSQTGQRMYKTGDLARWNHDGTLEYLGRCDNQVKIRGVRIELSEIEAILLKHPFVNQAIVTIWSPTKSEASSIVAYIIPKNEEKVKQVELQNYLVEHLPSYMLPNHIVVLSSFPHLTSGKIDRKRLPPPTVNDTNKIEEHQKLTQTQQAIISCWQKYLNIDFIGLHDDFFLLGGHSLIAMQINAHLQNKFGFLLPSSLFFSHSTPAKIAEYLESQLSKNNNTQDEVIPRIVRTKNLPLSTQQQRIWFLSKLEGASTLYNIPISLVIQGSLDLKILQRCFEMLLKRHEVLNSRYYEEQGQVIQQIVAEHNIAIEHINLSSVSVSDEKQKKLEQYQRQIVNHHFDLAKGPLIKIACIEMDEKSFHLLIVLHHIITDGWSLNILIRELVELYTMNLQQVDVNSIQPNHSIQYADYAAYQLQKIENGDYDDQINYWRSQLNQSEPLLNLPCDYSRGKQQLYNGKTYTFYIPKNILFQLRLLSQQENASLFMVLLAAFKIVLYRYSGQKDICIGVPIANRKHVALQNLIGFLANTLVLRSKIDSTMDFSQYLSSIRKITLDAYDHQDLPFAELIKILQPERSLSYSPLFQVMFVLQNIHYDEINIPDLKISHQPISTGSAKFDITLELYEYSDYIQCQLEYNSDLFKQERIERFSLHYLTLLNTIIEDRRQNVATIPLLTGKEQHLLLNCWSGTQFEVLRQRCIHKLFEDMVVLYGDQVAIRANDASLTYSELNTYSNKFARFLQSKKNIQMGDIVGVCLTRNSHLIIALIAIFKLGAAYVPLDPNYPKQRLEHMLIDSKAKLVILDNNTDMIIGDLASTENIEQALVNCSENEAGNLSLNIDPMQVAYLIYTSGSTGLPKGVAITHSNVYALIDWAKKTYDKDQLSSVCAATSLCFDLSIFELFVPLCTGGSVALVDNIMQLIDQAPQCHLSLINTVPSAIFALLQRNAIPETVRTINLAGERLSQQLVEELYSLSHIDKVYDLYGPSEDTTYSTIALRKKNGVETIGCPVNNTKIYLLDSQLQPVPQGVAGEIYLSGAGLAQGYLFKPSLTAAKFIPNPYSNKPGDRLYRTGDLAVFIEDGYISYLGRIDHQIKLRGFRIELNEINNYLRQHKAVRDALTLVSRATEPQLISFVVSSASVSNLIEELKSLLQNKLPNFMLPQDIHVLKEFPLLPNGKIAIEELYQYSRVKKGVKIDSVIADKVEKELLVIWKKLLEREDIDTESSFFSLGGHSLMAISLLTHIEQQFGVKLSLTDLFTHTNIRMMAVCVRSLQNQKKEDMPVLVADRSRINEPFPLTSIQQAYWLGRSADFSLGNVATHQYNEFSLSELDVEKCNFAWNQLILRHDMLRAVIKDDGTQQILENVPYYKIPKIELKDSLEEAKFLNSIRQEMIQHIFNVGLWPLFDLRISRVAKNDYRVHISIDAIIVDAMSYQILLNDFYQYYTDNNRVLPALDLSFRDYVNYNLQLTNTALYQTSKKYWLDRISEMLPGPQLPQVQNSQQLSKPSFIRFEHVFDKSTYLKLQKISREYDITVSVLLLTAYGLILKQWSTSPCFTINITLFNRPLLHKQIAQLVGDFTSLTLFKFDQKNCEHFYQLAKSLKQKLWEDLDHGLFNGIDVLRELTKHNGNQPILMPVVFTSTLGAFQQRLALPGKLVYSQSQTSQVWLDHIASEREGELHLVWDVVKEIFPEGMIEDMFGAYVGLLQQIIVNNNLDMEIIAPALPQQQSIVRNEANATQKLLPLKTLHELAFDNIFEKAQNFAIISSEQNYTYAQLYKQVLSVAYELQKTFNVHGKIVAIYLNKGCDQVVAVLACHYAGASYLPLTVSQPLSRLEQIFDVAKVSVVITHQILTDNLPTKINKFCIDQVDQNLKVKLEIFPKINLTELAYVIFTSGSTGVPKGVMITHKAAANTLLDINQRFGVSSKDKILALSELSFDLSVYDIFGMLAQGGCIVIPTDQDSQDPAKWYRYLVDHEVSLLNIVPAYAGMLIDYLEATQQNLPDQLRLIMLSGDYIPTKLPKRVQAKAKNIKIISLGGATEAAIWSIYYPVEDNHEILKTIPYGKPLYNQQFYILKNDLSESPNLVPGELYIAGEGLAQGYINDPEKTALAFIDDDRRKIRLYRTGDLGYYLPDGNIEFLGRNDNQVKINGFRVELGEIESALMQHEAIKQAVVIKRGMRPNTKLFAYYVLKNQHKVSKIIQRDIETYLKTRLPHYMLPTKLINLDSLPLSANGKVDRKQLENLDDVGVQFPEDNFYSDEVNNNINSVIFAVIADVTGIQNLTASSNLLELGLNSLDIVRIFNQLEKDLGKRPDFASLYRHPKIQTLFDFYQNIDEHKQSEPKQNNLALEHTLLVDPIQREEFKRLKLSLRQDLDALSHCTIPLTRKDEASYVKQRSIRQFVDEQVPLDKLSQLLSSLGQYTLDGKNYYPYPSAGGLYPIQIYLYLKPNAVKGCRSGIYYYNQVDPELYLITECDLEQVEIHEVVNRPVNRHCKFSLFLIAKYSAIVPMYGEYSQPFSLIEVGSILQLLMMKAPSLNIGLCPVGNLEFSKIREYFKVDHHHQLLHTVLGGISYPDAYQVDANPGISLSTENEKEVELAL